MTRTKLAEQIAAAAHDCDDVGCPCDPLTTIYATASTRGIITLVEGPPETIAAVVQVELDQRDAEIKRLNDHIDADPIARTRRDLGSVRALDMMRAAGRMEVAAEVEPVMDQLLKRAVKAEAAIARVQALATNAARTYCGAGWDLNPADVLAALDQPAETKEG